MKLDKIIDTELRRTFGYNKSTNISSEDLKRVDALSLENLPLKSIQDIMNMTNLQSLNISGTAVTDMSVLSYCPELKRLAFYECPIKDLSFFATLENLKELYFNTKVTAKNIHYLDYLVNVELLDITLEVGELNFLSNLSKIRYLHINSKMIDLKGIEKLEQLQYLELDALKVSNWEFIKELPNLKEVVYLNLSNKEKELIQSYNIEVNQVAESSPFDPVFLSELSLFTLDSRLKQDALDFIKAFGVLDILLLLIVYGILIFNKNATMNFWEATLFGSSIFLIGIPLAIWLYSMHFELEFQENHIKLNTITGNHIIPFVDIQIVQVKQVSMRQPKIKIQTSHRTYRLTCSLFVSSKKLNVMLNEFKERGIKTKKISKL